MARKLTQRRLSSGQLVWVAMSEVADGDIAVGNPEQSVATKNMAHSLSSSDAHLALPPGEHWTFLQQVHGDQVVHVDRPGGQNGLTADGAVTDCPGAVLAIAVADCLPIALISEGGGVAALHAGWRGTKDGIIEATVNQLRKVSPGEIAAVMGPSIGPCCYAFGLADRQSFVDQFGSSVVATTTDGNPALNLRAAAICSLNSLGINEIIVDDVCTSCDDRHWSYRASKAPQRQALVVWQESTPSL